MPGTTPPSLRWLFEHLAGVTVGTPRAQKVLGHFLDRAKDAGAHVVHADDGPVAIEWPDGTSLSIAALALGVMHWPARGPVH